MKAITKVLSTANTNTTVKSCKRRECMLMVQDSICRISEDGA